MSLMKAAVAIVDGKGSGATMLGGGLPPLGSRLRETGIARRSVGGACVGYCSTRQGKQDDILFLFKGGL